MKNLLLKNMELEKEFKDINLDGAGEFVKEMVLDLHWHLFTEVQDGEEDYVIQSANEYAELILENKEEFILALEKADHQFIQDMNSIGHEIDGYTMRDNSMDYLNTCLEFFEDTVC